MDLNAKVCRRFFLPAANISSSNALNPPAVHLHELLHIGSLSAESHYVSERSTVLVTQTTVLLWNENTVTARERFSIMRNNSEALNTNNMGENASQL